MLAFNILALFTALIAFSASASPIPAGALLSGLEANTLPGSLTPSADHDLDGRQLGTEGDDEDIYNSVGAGSSDTVSLIKRLDLVGNNAARAIADDSADLAKRLVLAGAV